VRTSVDRAVLRKGGTKKEKNKNEGPEERGGGPKVYYEIEGVRRKGIK